MVVITIIIWQGYGPDGDGDEDGDGEVVAVFVVPVFCVLCRAALDLEVEASPFQYGQTRSISCIGKISFSSLITTLDPTYSRSARRPF
jgi:hypothetical protein